MTIGQIGRVVLATLVLSGNVSTAEPEPEGLPRYKVDHMFFFAKPFAPEMTAFEVAGFIRWPFTTSHTDQGTRGRYVYLDNFYIEFLWIHDAEIADANSKRAGIDMNARGAWRNNASVSPFGIGLRDHDYDAAPSTAIHVYKADWMGPEEGDFLGVFTPENRINEPSMFRMPPHWTKPAREELGPQSSKNLDHPNGVRVLTAAEFTVTGDQPLSEALQALSANGAFDFIRGDEPLVRLTFDEGMQGKMLDFRPESPVIIHY